MSALSNVHASTLLNTSLRSGTYYLALFLTDPTASGTGTEVSGGGYARTLARRPSCPAKNRFPTPRPLTSAL
mgnify:CR=1 FL=1